jgi:Tfp pilus assembly protein PilX
MRARARDESGIAMVIVVALSALLVSLAAGLLVVVAGESSRSSQSVRSNTAFAAAEAGVQDYTAKLLEDSAYYLHMVAAGESTRKNSGGTTVAAGHAWTGDTTWTYPNGRDAWRQLGNGYEYDLRISGPSATSSAVTINSTGRPQNDTNKGDWREVQSVIRPSSVADFQMIADADISYGSTATTTGRIYAGIDSNGVAHNITHDGTASGNIYAEGSIYGSTRMTNGAQKYDHNTIRNVIGTPINFNDFQISLVNVANAAQSGGIYLNNSSKSAWKLTFLSGGTVQVQSCTGSNINTSSPSCGSTTTYSVPSNGAIYVAQSAIVSGQVKGQVTVASNNDILVGGATTYVTPGTDVLGLAAANNVIIPSWAPSNITWWAAAIAENGQFESATSDGSHGTMTFNGSIATRQGGQMSMFQVRYYNYDSNLLYRPPPWWPTVGDAYTVVYERELPASS